MFMQMSVEKRNTTIRTAAHGFVAERHKIAIDWLALCVCKEEAEASAPWN